MSAAGLPERCGRWSPEQRSQADQTRRVMRFLVESALVPTQLLVDLSGRNAYNDAVAAGWPSRPWLASGGARSVGYRYHDPVEWEPPHMADVRLPAAPHMARGRVWGWVFANGCESIKALGEYRGERITARFVPSLPARCRGRNGWSLSELDRIHPDLTCADDVLIHAQPDEVQP